MNRPKGVIQIMVYRVLDSCPEEFVNKFTKYSFEEVKNWSEKDIIKLIEDVVRKEGIGTVGRFIEKNTKRHRR